MRPHRYLTVPGWHGSGPGHWQTLWELLNPSFSRIQQRSWDRPDRSSWLESIERGVASSETPAILVAHSLGALSVAHWAAESRLTRKVSAALLVAPAWFGCEDSCPPETRSFLPAPQTALPFPSLLVASRNDPYLRFEAAQRLSQAWQSPLVDAGHAGHINVSSGHGAWPEGEAVLRRLTAAE